MSRLKPDPTFYPSPEMALEAPPEKYGYVAGLNYGRNGNPDALLVIDLDERSGKYGQMISQTEPAPYRPLWALWHLYQRDQLCKWECNTLYLPRHFVGISNVWIGGSNSQRSAGRIGCQVQALGA